MWYNLEHKVRMGVMSVEDVAFSGNFAHTIDPKGRVTIPAAYREALSGGFTIGLNNQFAAIALYPKEKWAQKCEQLSRIPESDVKGTRYVRLITGNSFSTMSVFALNISPYITSSIIVQLLTIAIPRLEELSKEGEEGKKTINKITRYLTVALALIQSVSMAIGFGSNYLNDYTWYNVAMVAIVMTAGSTGLMWIGERISEKGVGNGISILLLVNILSGLPGDFATLYNAFARESVLLQKQGFPAFAKALTKGLCRC